MFKADFALFSGKLGGYSTPHMVHEYQLPERATTYVDFVVERSEALINSGIWSGLEVQQLRGWLSNFDSPLDRYFAARVLDHLIYRSDNQTEALINQVFQRCLPELLVQMQPNPDTFLDIVEALRNRETSPIRIVPVIDENDSPTKSGPTVARLVKRALALVGDWIIFPDQLDSAKHREAPVIVFVDDFLGTGYQFSRFFRRLSSRQSFGNKKVIYAPLVAHKRGLERLNKSVPNVRVTFAEQLDTTYNLFNKAISDGVNSSESMFHFYNQLLERKGLNLPRKQLGYGKLGLCLAFEHATPNSTLPLLWNDRAGFVPLFKR